MRRSSRIRRPSSVKKRPIVPLSTSGVIKDLRNGEIVTKIVVERMPDGKGGLTYRMVLFSEDGEPRVIALARGGAIKTWNNVDTAVAWIDRYLPSAGLVELDLRHR